MEDPYFTPRNPIEADNYTAKNKFVYSVLYSNVLTVKGRSLVLKYYRTKDGSQALADLDSYHSTSAAAIVRRSQAYSNLTTLRLDGTWKRSQMDFIINFVTLLRRHNEYATTPQDVVHDITAKAFLKNAVHDAPNLRDVAVRETQDMAMYNVGPMSFDKYLTCLEAAAGLHDSKTGKVSTATAINHTSLSSTDGGPSDVDMFVDGEDTAELLVNAADTARPRLPDSLFKQLSQQGKRAWTQLPDADKAQVVNALPRSVNVHEMASTSDFSPITDHGPTSTDTATTSSDSTQVASVNAASQDSSTGKPVARDGKHPADPRRLLSQPTAKPSNKPSTTPRQSNTVRFSAPTLTPYEAKAAIQSYWETEPADVWYDCMEDFWKAD